MKVVIIGGGYSGIAAAYQLRQNGISSILLEKANVIGGLSAAESQMGVKFEIGPHILFIQDKEILSFWETLLGTKLVLSKRKSGLFFKDKIIRSPLNPIDTFMKLGPQFIVKILLSFFASKIFPEKDDQSAKSWVVNNFGKQLYNCFYKVYNEKLWGEDCSEISATWSNRRIRFTLISYLKNVFFNHKNFSNKNFGYPIGGGGTIFQMLSEKINDYCSIRCNEEVLKIETIEDQIVVHSNKETYLCDYLINTIHLDELIKKLSPQPPLQVLEAAAKLKFRHLAVVYMTVDKKILKKFNYHWLDVHDPKIKMMRLTNFGFFHPSMRSENLIGVTAEYCYSDTVNSQELIELAKQEFKTLGFDPNLIKDSYVKIYRKAYTVPFKNHEEHLKIITTYLSKFAKLVSIGRNGLYKFNNIHHSIKTGFLAADAIFRGSFVEDFSQLEASVDFLGAK